MEEPVGLQGLFVDGERGVSGLSGEHDWHGFKLGHDRGDDHATMITMSTPGWLPVIFPGRRRMSRVAEAA